MSDATPRPTPARGPRPWGLAGMVALVAAVEGFVLRGNLEYTSDHAATWRATGRAVAREAPGHGTLCFGDSMVKFGLIPRVLERETGRGAYNLAVHGGSAPTSYFLLRRALEAGARPGAAVVDFSMDFLKDGPATSLSKFPWWDLLNARENLELALATRDPDLFARVGLGRGLASLRGRFEIRAQVLACLNGKPINLAGYRRALVRNSNRNQGAQVFPTDPALVDTALPPGTPQYPGTWRPDPVNVAYVRKFIELADAYRVRLYWVIPPLTPGTQNYVEVSGDDALYRRFVRKVQARYPSVVVLDAGHSGFGRELFSDKVHLGREGAVAFSRAVGAAVRDGTAAGKNSDKTSRWVDLPAAAGPPADVILEDITQTKTALQAAEARVLR